MIEVRELYKRFGDLKAVDGISFTAGSGEIYGLLGPNGAGKTTTLSMIAGLLAPDSGSIRFDGIDVAAEPLRVKASLGVVPQENALYEELSATEHLNFWGGLYGLSGRALKTAVATTLDQVGLAGRAKEPVRGFSGGMKRRLNLGMGLIHQPKAILLDEPTVGIDPQARANILEVVRQVADAGTTVLYTTHYLEEAEQICDRIGIVDHGRLLAEGTLEELQRRVGGEEIVTLRGDFDVDALRDRLLQAGGVRLIAAEKGKLVVATGEAGKRGSVELLQHLFQQQIELDGLTLEPPSLNGLFLKLTGRELRD